VNTLNLKPVIRYQLSYVTRSILIGSAIAAAVAILFYLFAEVIIYRDAININIGGLLEINAYEELFFNINISGFITIFLFILGIAAIREDLRMFIQHGVGRRTTYFSTLISGLISGVALGLVCQLFYLALSALFGSNISIITPIDAVGFFGNWLLNAITFFAAWQVGALISLIYYRLNKIGAIIFSIVGGLFILQAIPWLILSLIGDDIGAFEALIIGLVSIFDTPFYSIFAILIFAAAAAIANFLLIRRVAIKV
jgi:hypothetical protein